MKLMKLFAVLALLGVSNAAFGYSFAFKNKTNDTINLQVSLEQQAIPVSKSLASGELIIFQNDFCIKSVLVNGQEVYVGSDISKGKSACYDTDWNITGTKGNYKLVIPSFWSYLFD